MPKFTLRLIASYLILNGLIIFFVPQLFSHESNFLYRLLVVVLAIFAVLSPIAGIQIFLKKSIGISLGAIASIPFAFSLSLYVFSFKLHSFLNFLLTLEYNTGNGDFHFGFNFLFPGNYAEVFLNSSTIGTHLDLVMVAIFILLLKLNSQLKENSEFPIESY